MVLCLSFENENLATRALEQLLDFLEAGGSYSELVVRYSGDIAEIQGR